MTTITNKKTYSTGFVVLFIVKPGVQEEIKKKMIEHITDKGFIIMADKLVTATPQQARAHYSEPRLVARPNYEYLIEYTCSRPLHVFVAFAENAVSNGRKIMDLMRLMYSVGLTENALHCSSSDSDAIKEIKLWFPENPNIHEAFLPSTYSLTHQMSMPRLKPFTLVLCGPSCAGKTELSQMVQIHDTDLNVLVSHTTRPPRDGEVHEKDYYFVKVEDFTEGEKNGDFIEVAEYLGAKYGLTYSEYYKKSEGGMKPVVVVMSTEGVEAINNWLPKIILNPFIVFVAAPLQDLKKRMDRRGWSPTQIKERIDRGFEDAAFFQANKDGKRNGINIFPQVLNNPDPRSASEVPSQRGQERLMTDEYISDPKASWIYENNGLVDSLNKLNCATEVVYDCQYLPKIKEDGGTYCCVAGYGGKKFPYYEITNIED